MRALGSIGSGMRQHAHAAAHHRRVPTPRLSAPLQLLRLQPVCRSSHNDAVDALSLPTALPLYTVWGANTGVGKTLASVGLAHAAKTLQVWPPIHIVHQPKQLPWPLIGPSEHQQDPAKSPTHDVTRWCPYAIQRIPWCAPQSTERVPKRAHVPAGALALRKASADRLSRGLGCPFGGENASHCELATCTNATLYTSCHQYPCRAFCRQASDLSVHTCIRCRPLPAKRLWRSDHTPRLYNHATHSSHLTHNDTLQSR